MTPPGDDLTTRTATPQLRNDSPAYAGIKIRAVEARSVLTRSGIPGADYCINPYVGCSHGCLYCYASFMKQYTGHPEPWGTFVDVKVNAPDVLARQLVKASRGNVVIGSVTDAYQPLEAEHLLTRRCLEVLLRHRMPVSVLTKSPLVLRDVDLFQEFEEAEIGVTLTTNDETIKEIFEPNAPSIAARVETFERLTALGLTTYVFVGPVLPMQPGSLLRRIVGRKGEAPRFHIDRMNYVPKTRAVYRRLRLDRWLDRSFVSGVVQELRSGLDPDG